MGCVVVLLALLPALRALDLLSVPFDLGRGDETTPGDLLGPQRTAVDRIR